jgi:hypothetical protein
VDVVAAKERRAIEAVQGDSELMAKLRSEGVRFGAIQRRISEALKAAFSDAFDQAYPLVEPTIASILGQDGYSKSRDSANKVVFKAKH